jgi:hypothetical protein
MQERRRASPTHTTEEAVGGAEVSLDISVGDYTMGGVAIFDAHTGRGPVGEYSVIFLDEVLVDRGAEAETGQLAVVPAPAVASDVVVGAKGPMQDPWAKFCASGEIASAAVTKDLLAQVCSSWSTWVISSSGNVFVYCYFESDSPLCQVTAFAERIASGALTLEFAAERRWLEGRIERLRTQHTEVVRDKSAAENKSRNLLEKAEAEKEDLSRQLATEKENAESARVEAQAVRDRAHVET